MVPFPQLLYTLTVLYTLGSGFVFLLPLLFPTKESWETVNSVLFRALFMILSGVMGLMLAILKLFFPVAGVVVFGDFLPVLALSTGCLFHWFGYIRNSRSLDPKLKEKGVTILSGLQVPAGIALLAVGLIHLFLGPIPVL